MHQHPHTGRPTNITRLEARHTPAIAGRILIARQLRGMQQQQLGAALGVTFQQIQKYERGANTVSAGGLLEIAQALDLPPSFFLDDCDGAVAAAVKPAPDGTHLRLAGRIGRLPADVRASVEALITAAEAALCPATEG